MAHKVVLIEWLDAHRVVDEDSDVEANHAPLRTFSAGMLLRSDADGVSFAPDLTAPGEETEDHTPQHFIPRAMIVRERTFPAAAPRRRRRTK